MRKEENIKVFAPMYQHAKRLFFDMIKKYGNDLVVYFDPDVDGILAGYIMVDYLRRFHNINPRMLLNENRSHGVDFTLFDKECGIINVDSSILYSQLKDIQEKPISVLSLDHHSVSTLPKEQETRYLTVNDRTVVFSFQYNDIEKQWKQFDFLSGAGVVWLFLKMVDPNYNADDMERYVGITLLSDNCPIENPLARGILEKMYQTKAKEIPFIHNNLNKFFATVWDNPESNLDRHTVDFIISPVINAALRCGETYTIINAICDSDRYTLPLRKELQKSIRDILTEHIEVLYDEEFKVIILNGPITDKHSRYETNMLGLIANRILNDTHKSCLILYLLNGKLTRGSFRGFGQKIDYLEILQQFGFNVEGHKAAFGILGLPPTIDWESIGRTIKILEDLNPNTSNIVELQNLKLNLDFIHQIAYENQFLLSPNKIKIKYKGLGSTLKIKRKTYIVYDVNGIEVKGFHEDLTMDNGWIIPILKSGTLEYILEFAQN